MIHPFATIERKDGDMSTGFRPIRGLTNVFGAMPLVGIAVLVYMFYSSFDLISDPIVTVGGVTLTGGFVALACAGLLLPFEIAKSADTGTKGIIDVGLSVILFCALWMTFVLSDFAQTPYFLILCLLQTADALGGGTVAIISARRDFATGA